VTESPSRAHRAPQSPSSPQPPSAPDQPGRPSSGTEVLEREQTKLDPGDHERFAHYVRKDKIAASALTGKPVVALCGKVWVPGRDPSRFPVCPACKAIYESMTGGGPASD
jgi:hypothetical protein